MRALLIFVMFSAVSVFAGSRCTSVDIAQFSADPVPPYGDAHFASFRVTRADLNTILDTYHEIAPDIWLHHYSHVARGDRTGTITLKDGRIIKWLVRPGGLATLRSADGATHYLAREMPGI